MRVLFLSLLLAVSPFVQAGEPAPFAGHYGHGATDGADDVVWVVEDAGTSWRITRTTDGETADALRLNARGRDAFWTRMGWPVESSAEADCLSWGEKPASLEDLLADPPPSPVAVGEDYGLGVLCRVPIAARKQTGWLADNASDWFYYDPIAGVMELHQLR